MRPILVCLVGLTALLLPGCRPSPPSRTAPIRLTWEVIENRGPTFHAALTMVNEGRDPWPSHGWVLYFNSLRAILPESLPPTVEVAHVNGDLFRLTPTGVFPPLFPGDSLVIPFDAQFWAIKVSDAPSGFYFVEVDEAGRGLPPKTAHRTVRPFRTEKQTRRGPDDRLEAPTPASRFRANASLRRLPPYAVDRITPTPVRFVPGKGHFPLTAETMIYFENGLASEADFLAAALTPLLGARLQTVSGTNAEPGAILLRTGEVTVEGAPGGGEAYRLTITPENVEITGASRPGVFYGIQSLRALLPLDAYREARTALRLDAATVEDAPRFPYRGFHLDVARNFQSKEAVLRLLDLMAFYKLNTFHFHLTDDEGWRLEIPSLPELTAVGGRRGHTLDERDRLIPSYGSGPFPDRPPGSGHYSREDFLEILAYARDRHIEVIPEIDVPGHARAAIKAMEARYARLMAEGRPEDAAAFRLRDPDDASTYRSVQMWDDNVMNVCLPSTDRFLETVFDEIAAMYHEARAPLTAIHIGGDEVPAGVWEGSPACAERLAADPDLHDARDLWNDFLRRVSDLLAARGLTTAGWEEIALVERAGNGRVVKTPNPAFLHRKFRPYVWNNVWGWGSEDLVYKLANAGYEVVMSNATNLYFDLAYDKDPEEAGLYWAGFTDTRTAFEFVPFDLFRSARTDAMGRPLDPAAFASRVRPTEAGRRNILGLQGQLWSETLVAPGRMEYMAFPKLLGLAERAWAPRPAWATIADAAARARALDAAWNAFANRLGQRELPRLDRLDGGVGYRLPPPGAVIEDGMLRANTAFPGLTVRFTTDGSEPTDTSPAYTGPVRVDGPVKLKTFDTRGRGSRTVTVGE